MARTRLSYHLPPVLRPRSTWRYILCSTATLYVVYCWLFAMPLFSSNLPAYTGRYPVGVVDIEAPCDKRTISDITIKADGKPAFEVGLHTFLG